MHPHGRSTIPTIHLPWSPPMTCRERHSARIVSGLHPAFAARVVCVLAELEQRRWPAWLQEGYHAPGWLLWRRLTLRAHPTDLFHTLTNGDGNPAAQAVHFQAAVRKNRPLSPERQARFALE